MLKPLTLAFALTLTASVSADTDCNVKLREGNLNRLENPENVEQKLIKGGESTEAQETSAKSDMQFAVLTVKVAKGKSIGLYDYALKAEDGDEEFKTLGISFNGGPFQRDVWEVRVHGDTKVQWIGIHENDKPSRKGSETLDEEAEVKLLFEVPAGSKRFNLVSRLLDKALLKEYGVKQILDFDNMSADSAPAEKRR